MPAISPTHCEQAGPSGVPLSRRLFSLLLAVGGVAVVWLGVLPRLGTQVTVREHIKRNEAMGIDGSAKFYTELPGMPRFLDRIDALHRQEVDPFWTRKTPSPGT